MQFFNWFVVLRLKRGEVYVKFHRKCTMPHSPSLSLPRPLTCPKGWMVQKRVSEACEFSAFVCISYLNNERTIQFSIEFSDCHCKYTVRKGLFTRREGKTGARVTLAKG